MRRVEEGEDIRAYECREGLDAVRPGEKNCESMFPFADLKIREIPRFEVQCRYASERRFFSRATSTRRANSSASAIAARRPKFVSL